ncbi:hypothetical protein PUNSTDRAFT_145158 [Punctularia strigosozonata HHB-11173 SS5]|uniref:uncharacterized protein n=1 Tax=Punctularia strigosozonata (strain HHB-11173) TaxID=741275 RepID=UPI0004416BEF|nr:uncharacterized protein PUNSTDRAFT_145158 [Punctularia strigosozonata HHB-11173 SS5]EIN06605.1 hypothetical protein PUNSTDRAFT_145158 [Punctularia strigosozonata HHB-11173 SS5]
MAATRSASSGPLTVYLVDRSGRDVRVSGEVIEGYVEIHVPQALKQRIDTVEVDVTGYVESKISRQHHPNVDTLYQSKVPIFSKRTCLWTAASSASPAPSGYLRFIVRSQLPTDLPPSYKGGRSGHNTAVIYGIEVFGLRSGKARPRCQARVPFAVHPQGTPEVIDASRTLGEGWKMGWITRKFEKAVRQGLWGDYSHVQAEISLPDIPALPTTTNIPFRLKVVTRTKPIKDNGADEMTSKVQTGLFPPPPTDPSAITLRLEQHVKFTAGTVREETDSFTRTTIPHLAGFGISPSSTPGSTKISVSEPQWMPTDNTTDGKLVCVRTVTFDATMAFNCTPTFKAGGTSCKYYVHICVPVPGLKNDLKCYVPVEISSRAHCPLPPPAPPAQLQVSVLPAYSSLDLQQSAPDYDEITNLDLPPSYWDNECHYSDEKDEKDCAEKAEKEKF